MNPLTPGGLTCFEVLAQLSDYLDGALSAPSREQVHAHVASCANCARFGGAVAVVLATMRGAGPPPFAGEPDPQVADRLDAAWRRAR